jgi:hypothetical protein
MEALKKNVKRFSKIFSSSLRIEHKQPTEYDEQILTLNIL